MAVNINLFLKRKSEQFQLAEVVYTAKLYVDIENIYIRNLFSLLHQEFNRLFKFMYSKTNGHFNAYESRQLIEYIKLYKDMVFMLKETEFSFKIKESYEKMIIRCSDFLVPNNGSTIPDDLQKIQLDEYEPIFEFAKVLNIQKPSMLPSYQLRYIGSGSYAHVYRYSDEFYQKNFVVKRAKSDLTLKEIERFKKEYKVMKEFSSPYVIEVYRYDDDKNEYIMECADETLFDYIRKNNSLLKLIQRKNIATQVLRGLCYIHSKGYLHRDLSFTNILLIHYHYKNF